MQRVGWLHRLRAAGLQIVRQELPARCRRRRQSLWRLTGQKLGGFCRNGRRHGGSDVGRWLAVFRHVGHVPETNRQLGEAVRFGGGGQADDLVNADPAAVVGQIRGRTSHAHPGEAAPNHALSDVLAEVSRAGEGFGLHPALEGIKCFHSSLLRILRDAVLSDPGRQQR